MFGFSSSPADAEQSSSAVPVPAELMRRVRRIEITTKRLVNEGIAGGYHSVFRGRGVEFSEVRPYQPGDDIRSIDWNVTARMGVPFVKQFVEERDLTIFLVVDVSGSLSFGSRAILKRELAAEISALLAFAAVRNQDRVGAALVAHDLVHYLRPERRRNHVLRLVRDILSWPASGTTDLERSLRSVLQNLKQRSVLFVISDFVDTRYASALKAAASRHDVILVELVDPRDNELPATSSLVLRDAETGEQHVVSGRRWRQAHETRRRRERGELTQLSRRLGVDHLELRTDRPYLAPLVRFFELRRRRLTR